MARVRTPLRMLVALLVFGIAWAAAQAQNWEWTVAKWVLQLGEKLGHEYANLSGRILMTPDGPFLGGPSWMNYAFRVLPELSVAIAAFVPAAAAYWLLGRGRSRPDGHTRCGRCGYILRGLTEPRCPECGQAI